MSEEKGKKSKSELPFPKAIAESFDSYFNNPKPPTQSFKDKIIQLEEALNFLNIGLCISDDKGKVTFSTQVLREMLKVSSAKEFSEINFLNEFSPIDQELMKKSFKENKVWEKDTLIRNISVSVKSQYFSQGSFIIYQINEVPDSQTSSQAIQNNNNTSIIQLFKEIIHQLPSGLGIWHYEESSDPDMNPCFRLISLNEEAKKRINPVELEEGKTIFETLKEPKNREISQFFYQVLKKGEESIDQFSLDGKAHFSIKVFPLSSDCIGIYFNERKINQNIYKWTFDYQPNKMTIFHKPKAENEYYWVDSNFAAKQIRPQRMPETLSQYDPAFSNSQLYDLMKTKPTGSVIKIALNSWTDETLHFHFGGLFIGNVTLLPEDYVLFTLNNLDETILRSYQSLLNLSLQRGLVADEDLRDYLIFNATNPNEARKMAEREKRKSHTLSDKNIYGKFRIGSSKKSKTLANTNEGAQIRDERPFILTDPSSIKKKAPSQEEKKSPSSFQIQPVEPPILPSLSFNRNPSKNEDQGLRNKESSRNLPPSISQTSFLNFPTTSISNPPPPQYPIRSSFMSSRENTDQFFQFPLRQELNLEIFKKTFYQLNIGMFLMSPQSIFLAVNDSFSRTLGYIQEDFIGKSFVPITFPGDLDKIVGLVRQIVSGEIHSYIMVQRYLHKRGHIVWGLLYITLSRDIHGAPSFLVGSVYQLDELMPALINANHLEDFPWEIKKQSKDIRQKTFKENK